MEISAQKESAERKRAEEELRHREADLRDALRAAQMGVWNWTVETDAVTWDETLYRIMGRDPNLPPPDSKEEAEIFTAESLERLNAAVQKTLTTGTPYELDVEIVLPDGAKKWLVARGEPRRDAQGRITWLRGTLQDITERKRSQEVKAFLASIVESSGDAIIGESLDGTILSWNKGAEVLYGYSGEEVIGKPISMLAPAERSAEIPNILASIRRREKVSHFETVRRRKDGTLVDVSVTVSPIMGANGEVTGAATITHDISERKRRELELRRAKEDAEAASRAKSEFLATMSHEIRTPMNGIIGMTDLALDTPLSPEQREYLKAVRESAETLLTVINDILDFSKIEAGRLSVDSGEFDLQDTLSNTLRSLAPRAHEKGLELTWETLPDLPPRLVGDPGRLRQIVVNLVGNAIKFTERGEVDLRVEIESQGTGWVVLHFCVTDTGIGIPREKRRQIFEPFVQVDSSTTRKYGGTGLGLAISTRLVNLMGGRIWLESELNQGSRFHFTAKFGLVKEPPVPPTPQAKVSLQGTPVLVIDDNATNRRILEAMLKGWSMQPVLVESGQEGLLAMRRARDTGERFPLILLDAHMPGMDGFSVAEGIKQDPSLAGCTIMMLTSAGQRGDAARCREVGISGYLVKPIRRADLLEAMLLVLGQPSQKKTSPDLVTRHTIREARRKLRILLAEDNAINQELVMRLLQKQGHTVLAAATGGEAVDMWEKDTEGFAIVLMDVQMPEVDGFQATAMIREREKVSGEHVPIIAMTAYAMTGDRERCLAAGMDAYVSKPIRHQELVETIQSLVLDVPNISPPPPEETPKEVLDEAQLMSRVDNDPQLLRDLVDLFLAEYPRLLDEIRVAFDKKDARAAERGAHSLRGSAGNLAAKLAAEAAFNVERLAQGEDWVHAGSALTELECQLERLRPALRTVQAETKRGPL